METTPSEIMKSYLNSQKFSNTAEFIPTIKQMHTFNTVQFVDIGGYDFLYTYIEYSDKAE